MVNSLEEFEAVKEEGFSACIFKDVDFSGTKAEDWSSYNLKGTVFLGCKFPSTLSEETLISLGANGVFFNFSISNLL